MCSVCGCGQPAAGPHHAAHDHGHAHDAAEGHPHPHPRTHAHDRAHDHFHAHADGHAHDHGGVLGATHAPGVSETRIVEVERNLLEANDRFAAANRQHFARRGIFALNLVSSPGSGKTTLLVRTIEIIKHRLPVAVIEGDQRTELDTDRIRATGVPAVQINTGRGCHLDAHMVGHAVERLAPAEGAVLFIENVGNLVCPAGFDLGEAHKVVLLSVTEGDDKPLKYPDMFAAADLMVVTKLDLLPFVPFEIGRCVDHARRINPAIRVIVLSSLGGEGLVDWLDWIEIGQRTALRAAASPAKALA